MTGADLQPGTLLAAYCAGLFPMPYEGRMGWWSPNPRGILDTIHVSRSLTRSRKNFFITINTAFKDVMEGCGDPRRPHGWINPEFCEAYLALHHLGWAHSIETRNSSGDLVGGLYGVKIGGLFAAESKFHRETDASKVALVALDELMTKVPNRLIDVQWKTPHLASLGVVEISREAYLQRLKKATGGP